MKNKIYNIDLLTLRNLIIQAYNELKIGRFSNIPSNLLADTVIDKIKINYKNKK